MMSLLLLFRPRRSFVGTPEGGPVGGKQVGAKRPKSRKAPKEEKREKEEKKESPEIVEMAREFESKEKAEINRKQQEENTEMLLLLKLTELL